MLLVTVSTTVSLYIGAEDSLRNEFPRDIIVRCSAIEEEDFDGICEEMRQSVVSCGGEMLDTIAYRFDVYTVCLLYTSDLIRLRYWQDRLCRTRNTASALRARNGTPKE